MNRSLLLFKQKYILKQENLHKNSRKKINRITKLSTSHKIDTTLNSYSIFEKKMPIKKINFKMLGINPKGVEYYELECTLNFLSFWGQKGTEGDRAYGRSS